MERGLSCLHSWIQAGPIKQVCERCGATCERDGRTGRIEKYTAPAMLALKPQRRTAA